MVESNLERDREEKWAKDQTLPESDMQSPTPMSASLPAGLSSFLPSSTPLLNICVYTGHWVRHWEAVVKKQTQSLPLSDSCYLGYPFTLQFKAQLKTYLHPLVETSQSPGTLENLGSVHTHTRIYICHIYTYHPSSIKLQHYL